MAEKVAENKVAKKAESQAANRKIKFSNPYDKKKVLLNTTPAQMAFYTAFDECAKALRNLSSVLPVIVKDQSDMMVVNGAVDHLINKAMADLRNEAAQIRKIADDNGIEMGRLSYTNAVNVDARLTCYRASQYLLLITEMDALICLIHSAWFAGFVTDDAKSRMERKWRRRVIGVAAEIRNIKNRAFKTYNNKAGGHENDDDPALTDDTPAAETVAGAEGSETAAPATRPQRKKKAAADQPAESAVA